MVPAEMAMTVAAEMPAATMAVTTPMSTVTPAVPTASVATAFADRHARKQGRENKDHNSDCRFGHGTLPCATRCCSVTTDRRRRSAKVPLAKF